MGEMLTVTPKPSPNPQESGELDNAPGMDEALSGPVVESTVHVRVSDEASSGEMHAQEPSPDQLSPTSTPVGEVCLYQDHCGISEDCACVG